MEKAIYEKIEFRNILPDELNQAIRIEQICFPPNEACTPMIMAERIAKASEMFLVAVDRSTNELVGFLDGISTNECKFRDEFFTDINMYDISGKNIMLLGLDVLPEYRGKGIARALVKEYIRREKANGRSMMFLTCLDSKVQMYKKFGFEDKGIADSAWGGEKWHEMVYVM